MRYFKTYTNHGWFLCFQNFFNNISLPFLKCEFWLLFSVQHYTLFSALCPQVPQHITYTVHQCHITEFSGWWGCDSTHGYLWLFDKEPKGEIGLSLQIKQKKSGVVLSEAWMLVADKLTCCGTLKERLLPCLQIYTNTPTHLMFLLISWGAIAPSPSVQSFCLCPSLYLLLVIYLGDAIRAAPTAAVALEMYWRSTQES